MHYESRMFLKNYFEPGGTKGFELRLSQFPDDSTIFNIISPFKAKEAINMIGKTFI